MRTYKATVRKGGRDLSGQRLTMEILTCPAITPAPVFSEEKLRRFLKNDPQRQGDDFFQAIALQSFFGVRPHQKTVKFYREVEGTFLRYALLPGRIVRIALFVSVHYESPLLRASEEKIHYRTAAAELILRETDGLNPAAYMKAAELLQTHGEPVGASRNSAGFGIADPRMISFFLRSDLTGDATTYLVTP